MTVRMKQVATCQVSVEWERVEYLLNCAPDCWDGHYTLEQIRHLLLAGELQFWHLRREGEDLPYLGAMTRIDVYGLKKVLNFFDNRLYGSKIGHKFRY